MKPLKISMTSRFFYNYPGGRYSLPESMEFFHDVGFEAMDLDLQALVDREGDWHPELDRLLSLSEKYDIPLGVAHLPFYRIRTEGLTMPTLMERAIDAAAYAGIPYSVIHDRGVSSEEYKSDAEWMAKELKYLTPFADMAAKKGVTLALENIFCSKNPEGGFLRRHATCADEILELGGSLGMENCWDFGHGHVMGLCQSKELRKLGKHLKVLHIHDNCGVKDQHLLPTFGDIDWRDAMTGLDDTGFDGLFNFEIMSAKTFGDRDLRLAFGKTALAVGRALLKIDTDKKEDKK